MHPSYHKEGQERTNHQGDLLRIAIMQNFAFYSESPAMWAQRQILPIDGWLGGSIDPDSPTTVGIWHALEWGLMSTNFLLTVLVVKI